MLQIDEWLEPTPSQIRYVNHHSNTLASDNALYEPSQPSTIFTCKERCFDIQQQLDIILWHRLSCISIVNNNPRKTDMLPGLTEGSESDNLVFSDATQ